MRIISVTIECFLSLPHKAPSPGPTTLVLVHHPRRMVRMPLALHPTVSTPMAALCGGPEYSCLPRERDALCVLLQQLREQTWSHLPSLHTRLGVGCDAGSKICRLWCLLSVLSILTPPPFYKRSQSHHRRHVQLQPEPSTAICTVSVITLREEWLFKSRHFVLLLASLVFGMLLLSSDGFDNQRIPDWDLEVFLFLFLLMLGQLWLAF